MRKKLLLLMVAPLFTGCYMKGNIQDVDVSQKGIIKANTIEFNAGAKPIQLTNGNYVVSHAVGNPVSEIQAKTNSGYQVFVSVQGQVFSEQLEVENF